jgi:hypothetical protein
VRNHPNNKHLLRNDMRLILQWLLGYNFSGSLGGVSRANLASPLGRASSRLPKNGALRRGNLAEEPLCESFLVLVNG